MGGGGGGRERGGLETGDVSGGHIRVSEAGVVALPKKLVCSHLKSARSTIYIHINLDISLSLHISSPKLGVPQLNRLPHRPVPGAAARNPGPPSLHAARPAARPHSENSAAPSHSELRDVSGDKQDGATLLIRRSRTDAVVVPFTS